MNLAKITFVWVLFMMSASLQAHAEAFTFSKECLEELAKQGATVQDLLKLQKDSNREGGGPIVGGVYVEPQDADKGGGTGTIIHGCAQDEAEPNE